MKSWLSVPAAASPSPGGFARESGVTELSARPEYGTVRCELVPIDS